VTTRLVLRLFATLALAAAPSAQSTAEQARAIYSRAVSDFLAGRIESSVDGFDALARLAPEEAPQLWQRGIAQYYAGRYRDCRAMFESHRTVNPDDVENAAWHFLCVARAESPQKARAALLPVGPDPRAPMTAIYQMFAGRTKPEEVLAAAPPQPSAQFYGHLYVGLYLEAMGDQQRALEHLRIAAAARYADAGGYMHAVARIHVALREGGK
jgi:lipoprotein NlpI